MNTNSVRFAVLLSVSVVLAGNCPAADPGSAGSRRPAPFVLEAAEDVSANFPGAPRLQSFAWAQWDGKWIFISGRTAGFHGVGGKDAEFLRAEANAKIWVVDPSASGPARTFSFPVASLPPTLAA